MVAIMPLKTVEENSRSVVEVLVLRNLGSQPGPGHGAPSLGQSLQLLLVLECVLLQMLGLHGAPQPQHFLNPKLLCVESPVLDAQ